MIRKALWVEDGMILEHYARRIPRAGSIILRIVQRARAHLHLTRAIMSLNPPNSDCFDCSSVSLPISCLGGGLAFLYL